MGEPGRQRTGNQGERIKSRTYCTLVKRMTMNLSLGSLLSPKGEARSAGEFFDWRKAVGRRHPKSQKFACALQTKQKDNKDSYPLACFHEIFIGISEKSIDKPGNGPLFISPSTTFSLGN